MLCCQSRSRLGGTLQFVPYRLLSSLEALPSFRTLAAMVLCCSRRAWAHPAVQFLPHRLLSSLETILSLRTLAGRAILVPGRQLHSQQDARFWKRQEISTLELGDKEDSMYQSG